MRDTALFRRLGAVCVAVAVALTPAVAAALTIHGTITNGTNGKPVDTKVIVVNPAGGMEQETTVEAKNGQFSAVDLPGDVGMYLVRADYEDVMYSAPVQVQGRTDISVSVTVYEKTSSWDGLHVLVPHVALAYQDGHLQVETLYEVHNHSDPPMTVAGKDAQFRVFIPKDKTEITRSFVSNEGVPIDRFPVPTDSAGVYRIDYPLRPGTTSIGISYSVPYTGEHYTLDAPLLHDIEQMTIYAVSPQMTITSSTLPLGPAQQVQGMTAYDLANLTAGTTMNLDISGGQMLQGNSNGEMSDAQSGGSQPNVIILPAESEDTSILIMVVVLLALVALMGISVRDDTNPLSEDDRVRDYYELVLKRLARLDDLHEAETVPSDVYRAKREELKTQLASLRYRLHVHDSSGKRASRRPRKRSNASRVARNHRSSTP